MTTLNVLKKVRRLSRKGKLLSDDPNLDEKKEMIAALKMKTNKSTDVSKRRFSIPMIDCITAWKHSLEFHIYRK